MRDVILACLQSRIASYKVFHTGDISFLLPFCLQRQMTDQLGRGADKNTCAYIHLWWAECIKIYVYVKINLSIYSPYSTKMVATGAFLQFLMTLKSE